MDLSTIPNIITALFSLFVYVTDLEQYGVEDDQRGHAASVKQGKTFRDDCDGFALTAVALLQEIKVEAWTVEVIAPKLSGGYLHMIAAYKDPKTGQIMTLDNLYPGARSFDKTMSGSLYKMVRSSRSQTG